MSESALLSQLDSSASDPWLGRALGSYRILSQLGQGGMGTVYLAEHLRLGNQVAIKLLHAEISGSPHRGAALSD